jgi:hypothetical protein
MGLTEVPSELFRMKNLKELHLTGNKLCSLPSEIALMTTLEKLRVRLLKRLDRELTKSRVVSGRPQPAHVSSARARSAYQSDVARSATLEADLNLDLTLRHRAFRSTTTSSRRSQQKSAS